MILGKELNHSGPLLPILKVAGNGYAPCESFDTGSDMKGLLWCRHSELLVNGCSAHPLPLCPPRPHGKAV